MKPPVPRKLVCIGCDREQDEVTYMLTMGDDRLPTCLCSDCIRDLHAVVSVAEPDKKVPYAMP